MERVIAYVDGFNLYFGLKDSGLRKYYWLNIQQMVEKHLKPHQKLILTRYFTARVIYPPEKQRRQSTYLEALGTLSEFQIHYGKYLQNEHTCRHCGHKHFEHSEKMTDVNIAVELLVDAMQDRYDTAVLISADSDLTGPIKAVKQLLPSKRIIVAFPPKRKSFDLGNVATGFFSLQVNKIAKSLFPKTITKPDGYTLQCPLSWK